MMDFSGKTAVVTGGTRGIGKHIVDLLVDLKCRVFYTGRARCKGKTARDSSKFYLQLDFTDKKSIFCFLGKIRKIPKIDILVNNAGINMIEPIDKINFSHWQKILEVNLTGAMQLMQEISNSMLKKRIPGRILNISSIFGVISKPKRDSYSASKSGLIGLTKAAALDLAPYGILVNALCPGFTLTDLTQSILSKDDIRSLCMEIPLGRFADQQEIAKIAVFLCSEMNTYMTGQALVVDGGFTIR